MFTALVCLGCLLTRDATPESTVKGLAEAFNGRDWQGVFSRIEGAKVDQAAAVFKQLVSPSAPMPKLTINISAMSIHGEMATGAVTIETLARPSGTPTYQDDEVHLHKVNGDWKISDGKTAYSMFTTLGEIGRNPKKRSPPRIVNQRTVVLSNLKQIALGVFMYANDTDDKIVFTQATMRSKLQPYLKNEKLWISPDGKPLDVRFNPHWLGKSMTSVPDPPHCVMLSLGPKSHLRLFDDMTPIAFMDGHVKFVTRSESESLKWK